MVVTAVAVAVVVGVVVEEEEEEEAMDAVVAVVVIAVVDTEAVVTGEGSRMEATAAVTDIKEDAGVIIRRLPWTLYQQKGDCV